MSREIDRIGLKLASLRALWKQLGGPPPSFADRPAASGLVDTNGKRGVFVSRGPTVTRAIRALDSHRGKSTLARQANRARRRSLDAARRTSATRTARRFGRCARALHAVRAAGARVSPGCRARARRRELDRALGASLSEGEQRYWRQALATSSHHSLPRRRSVPSTVSVWLSLNGQRLEVELFVVAHSTAPPRK